MGSEMCIRDRLIPYDENTNPNYKTILIRLNEDVVKYRKSILETMETKNIGARPYYYPLSDLALKDPCIQNALTISKSHLILPIGHSVEDQDIKFIIKALECAIRGQINE